MLHGADLSTYQRGVDYAELARAIGFAYVKGTDAKRYATGWLPFTDDMHEVHSLGLRSAGVPTGSYCFGHPSQDVNQSADYFVQRAWFDQLRPVLDQESLADAHVPANAGEWAKAWCDRVELHTGVAPIIYASASYAAEMLRQCPSLRDREWWIAAYPGGNVEPPERMPTVPGLLPSRVLAWQWTGAGTLPGVPGAVDRDICPDIGPLYVPSAAI